MIDIILGLALTGGIVYLIYKAKKNSTSADVNTNIRPPNYKPTSGQASPPGDPDDQATKDLAAHAEATKNKG